MSVAGILASNLFSAALPQFGQSSNGTTVAASGKSGAQSAFGPLHQKLSMQGYSASEAATSLPNQVTQLGNDLKSGNLSAAQSDFSTLRTTLTHAILSHQPSSTGAGNSSTGASQSSTQPGSSLESNALQAAWQAYSALQGNPGLSNPLMTNPSGLSFEA